MTSQYQGVLFFVFIGFFVLIGLVSLSSLFGFPKTIDKRFRKWSITGFVAAVTTAVVGLFNFIFLTPPPAPAVALASITVTLAAAPGMSVSTALTIGRYMYDEQTADNRVVTRHGEVVPVRGEGGLWSVKLPGEVSDKPTQLYLQDEGGGWWQVDRFFPNVLRQNMRAGKPFPQKPVPVGDASWPFSLAVVSAAGSGSELAAQEQATIKFNNTAKRTGDQGGRPLYEWRVFVDEPRSVLQTIARVDYVLHPTFPQPFQTSTDRDKAFELTASGWGGFTILVTVHFTNGREAKTSYFLDLNKGAAGQASVRLTLEKIHVEWDGSSGPTGWAFEVLVDGKTLFSLPNRNYDDGRSGRKSSDYLPDVGGSMAGVVSVARGRPAAIEVRGRRSFPFWGGDVVTGTATLDHTGGPVAVHVTKRSDPQDGSFVFSFMAVPKPE